MELIYLFVLYHAHAHYVDRNVGFPPPEILILLYSSFNITLRNLRIFIYKECEYLKFVFGIMSIRYIQFLLVLLTDIVRWIWPCIINTSFWY